MRETKSRKRLDISNQILATIKSNSNMQQATRQQDRMVNMQGFQMRGGLVVDLAAVHNRAIETGMDPSGGDGSFCFRFVTGGRRSQQSIHGGNRRAKQPPVSTVFEPNIRLV